MDAAHLNRLSDNGSTAGIFADYIAKFGINQLVNKVMLAEAANSSEEDFIYHLCELLMED